MTTVWQGLLSPVLRSGPMDVWLGPGKAVLVAFQQTEVPTPAPNENCLLCLLGHSMAQHRDPCVSEWSRGKEDIGCSVDMMSPLGARAANKEKLQDACTSWELQEVNVFCGMPVLCRGTGILCSQAVHGKGEGIHCGRSFILRTRFQALELGSSENSGDEEPVSWEHQISERESHAEA